MSARLWLVTDYGPTGGYSHVVDAAYVEAETVAEAAEAGRQALKRENMDDDQDYCETVAVTPADPPVVQWFRFDAKAIRCELQCCGGADTPHGHTGFCAQATTNGS